MKTPLGNPTLPSGTCCSRRFQGEDKLRERGKCGRNDGAKSVYGFSNNKLARVDLRRDGESKTKLRSSLKSQGTTSEKCRRIFKRGQFIKNLW